MCGCVRGECVRGDGCVRGECVRGDGCVRGECVRGDGCGCVRGECVRGDGWVLEGCPPIPSLTIYGAMGPNGRQLLCTIWCCAS